MVTQGTSPSWWDDVGEFMEAEASESGSFIVTADRKQMARARTTGGLYS